MPIYEYRCESCAEVTEAIQKLSDPPLKKCPSCSGKLKKLISRAAFHLKGGGWYSEGYGDSGKGSKKAASSSPSSTSSDGDAGKTKSDTSDTTGEVKSTPKKASATV